MTYVLRAVLWVIPLIFVAATCVSGVTQHGDAGPWTGEVVNRGDQTVSNVAAEARLFDATGREVYPGRIGAFACPSKLLPTERGAFALFERDDSYPPADLRLRDPRLPLRAEFDASAHAGVGTAQARGDGMLVTLLDRLPAKRIAKIRLTNNGAGAFTQFSVCGVLRTPDGRVASVGRADPPAPPYQLVPGASVDLEMPFDSMPDGDIRFHALGLLQAPYEDCCPLGATAWHSQDLGSFSVLLPPDWEYVPVQGIDSFAGQFAGGGVTLTFDFGWYSYPLPFDGDPAYDVHFETVGGFTAKLVARKGGAPGFTGVYIANVAAGPPGAPGMRVSLEISGENLTVEQQRIALQIFRSLRFLSK